MRDLFKTLIVLCFLFAVIYSVLKVLTGQDYNPFLVFGPVVLGIILILLMNVLFKDKKNPWIIGKDWKSDE